MENMINKIIDMDKMARQMEADAQENKNHFQEEIDRRKKELYDQYDASLKEIMEMTDMEQEKMLLDGKQELEQQAGQVLARMEEAYSQKETAWADHIYQAVISKD